MDRKICELLFNVIESDDSKKLHQILIKMKKLNGVLDENTKASLILLIETFQLHPDKYRNTREFLIEIPKYLKTEMVELRSVLPLAIKKKLPLLVNKEEIIQGIGFRFDKFSLKDCYNRYLRLLLLVKGNIYYNINLYEWGMIGDIDWFNGKAELINLDIYNNFNFIKTTTIELTKLFDGLIIFDNKDVIKELLTSFSKTKLLPPSEVRKLLIESTKIQIDELTTRHLLYYTLVPKKKNKTNFEKWFYSIFNKKTEVDNLDGMRDYRDLNTIFLKKELDFHVNENNIEHIVEILNSLNIKVLEKDYVTWAETICWIVKKADEEEIKKLSQLNPEIMNIVFPENFQEINPKCYAIWCNIDLFLLPQWVKFTKVIMGEDYLVRFCLHLPWRAWQAIVEIIEIKILVDKLIIIEKMTSPEIFLWIWENRNDSARKLSNRIDFVNYFNVLSKKKEKLVWNRAYNKLSKLLIGNPEFQKLVLDSLKDEDDIIKFLEKFDKCLAISFIQKQKFIVKQSREYPLLKEVFESGKARTILAVKKN